jgi:alpha-1,2-mannosyltransferase
MTTHIARRRAVTRLFAARIPRAAPALPSGPIFVFLASAALLVAAEVTALPLPPIHSLHRFGFFDLRVYREAASTAAHGGPLYGVTLSRHLGFTYPPIAAALFFVLRLVSLRADEALVTTLNLGLVVVVAHAALRLRARSVSVPDRRPGRAGAAWLLAAAALWIEPVTTAIGYGQIDLLIAALIIVDLAWDDRSGSAGIAIGIAAALKLTPLIFLPYLLFAGRRRAAGRALLTFLSSIALSFVLVPADARAFWGGAIFDTSRVTGRKHSGGGPANQSLHGLLMRIAPGLPHLSVVWALSCACVGGVGLLLAVRSARRGDMARGFVLTAVTGLLVSPISWTHHWAIAVPGLLLLPAVAARRPVRILLAAATGTLAAGASAIWQVIDAHPLGEHLGVGGFLLGNLYVLAGLAAIAAAAVPELVTLRVRRRPRVLRRLGSRPAGRRLDDSSLSTGPPVRVFPNGEPPGTPV